MDISNHISKVQNDEGAVRHARFPKMNAVVHVLVVKLPSPVVI